jgi:hypothetical protein
MGNCLFQTIYALFLVLGHAPYQIVVNFTRILILLVIYLEIFIFG